MSPLYRLILNNVFKMSDKNNDKSLTNKFELSNGFYMYHFVNESDFQKTNTKDVKRSLIQFHFCVKGGADFIFNNGNYLLPIDQNKVVLLFNPEKDLPINLKLNPKSSILSIIISIKKFHSLFSSDAENIPFLSDENTAKKYYETMIINPSMNFVINQITKAKVNNNMKSLYLTGKIYELLSLCFSKSEDSSLENCPFLADEDNVRKIRNAKEIVLQNFSEPPSLTELSNKVEIGLNKLKEGFKELYGDTVYGYLLTHKMEEARRMLDSGKYNVNEVGLKVGYSTASHFIAAFKKKFGITPKKYLLSLSS